MPWFIDWQVHFAASMSFKQRYHIATGQKWSIFAADKFSINITSILNESKQTLTEIGFTGCNWPYIS